MRASEKNSFPGIKKMKLDKKIILRGPLPRSGTSCAISAPSAVKKLRWFL